MYNVKPREIMFCWYHQAEGIVGKILTKFPPSLRLISSNSLSKTFQLLYINQRNISSQRAVRTEDFNRVCPVLAGVLARNCRREEKSAWTPPTSHLRIVWLVVAGLTTYLTFLQPQHTGLIPDTLVTLHTTTQWMDTGHSTEGNKYNYTK